MLAQGCALGRAQGGCDPLDAKLLHESQEILVEAGGEAKLDVGGLGRLTCGAGTEERRCPRSARL